MFQLSIEGEGEGEGNRGDQRFAPRRGGPHQQLGDDEELDGRAKSEKFCGALNIEIPPDTWSIVNPTECATPGLASRDE